MAYNEIIELLIEKRSGYLKKMLDARDAQSAACDRRDFEEADRQGEEAKAAFAAMIALDDAIGSILHHE